MHYCELLWECCWWVFQANAEKSIVSWLDWQCASCSGYESHGKYFIKVDVNENLCKTYINHGIKKNLIYEQFETSP